MQLYRKPCNVDFQHDTSCFLDVHSLACELDVPEVIMNASPLDKGTLIL